MPQTNSALMSGVPELLVLKLLAAREMYGYEIARAIRTLTREAVSVGEGVLYPALHAMEVRGLLRTRRRAVAGRTRVYYAITARGRNRLERLAADWQRISGGVAAVFGAADHA